MNTIDNLIARVNDNFEFSNEQMETVDILPIDDRHFHILINKQSFRAELIRANYQDKSLSIKVNGNMYDIALSDKYDQLVAKLGLDVVVNNAALDINAPMPGLVLDILVEAGQTLEEGMPVAILEAMKMENVLKAGGTGTVEAIAVDKGAAVEKGQLLIKVSND